MAKAFLETSTAGSDLIFAFDDDDMTSHEVTPDLAAMGGPIWSCVGPRMTCGQWTNSIAVLNTSQYRTMASLGDDHVPETMGWDQRLLGAVAAMGGTGISYGDDTLQHANLPTAPVVSSDIIRALGWFFLPGLVHFFADNVWKDLGKGAQCLAYCPEVTIRHLHYTSGLSANDETYQEAAPAWDQDHALYLEWQRSGLAADARTIHALRD